jgi:ankyrin repeat protein
MSGLLAARAGDLAKTQRLIGEGASVHEVNEFGENALLARVFNGHAPIVHWLLKKGGARISDVDNHGWTALSLAVACGHYSLVQWLLEEGCANITDTVLIYGEDQNVWDHLKFDQSGA